MHDAYQSTIYTLMYVDNNKILYNIGCFVIVKYSFAFPCSFISAWIFQEFYFDAHNLIFC